MTDLTTALPLDPSSTQHASGRRPHVWRWMIAFLVSVSMLLAMTGIAVVAQSGSAGGPAYLPATTVAYAELRMDLPGDQREQLAAFMARFPGFADAASFDTKLDQILDQALSSATGGAATWTGNIEPWSNGQFSLGLLEIPSETAMTTEGTQPPMVVGLGIKDRAALEAQIGTMITGEPVNTEEYAGSTITTAGDTAYAITDQYLLISPSADDIKISLDVLAGTTPSLTEAPDFQTAAAATPADDLAEFYLSIAALKPFIEAQLSQQAGGEMLVGQLDNLPTWMGAYLQVGDDHLTLAASTQFANAEMVPSVRATDIAAHFPADTLVFLETRDLGRTVDTIIAQALTQLPADPGTTQLLTGIEQQLGTTVDKLLDFVEDGGVGVSFDGQELSVGIVATLSDEAVGSRRIQTLLGLMTFASTSPDAPFTLSTQDVDGTSVTKVTFSDAVMGDTSSLPFEPAVSIAVADGHLYLGLGDFAATAIAQDPATSLGTAPRYVAAVADAGTPNAGVMWLDIAGAATLAESLGATSQMPDYTTQIKPFVDAFDAFVASATVDGDVTSLKALLFVK